ANANLHTLGQGAVILVECLSYRQTVATPPTSTLFPSTTLFRSYGASLPSGTQAVTVRVINGQLNAPFMRAVFNVQVRDKNGNLIIQKITKLHFSDVDMSSGVFCVTQTFYVFNLPQLATGETVVS